MKPKINSGAKASAWKEPQTPAEWQEAVDVAELMLAIDSAKQYGLIEGGPVVNAKRCEDVLSRGRASGYRPRPLKELLRAMSDAG